jgi:hypothetical protein
MFDPSRITYTLEIEPEDTPIRGHAMASGDDASDRETEDWIIAELNRGNEWAWCVVKVTARYPGLAFEGTDYLGTCSYRNEADFKADGYWGDMQEQARADLLQQVDKIRSVLCEA